MYVCMCVCVCVCVCVWVCVCVYTDHIFEAGEFIFLMHTILLFQWYSVCCCIIFHVIGYVHIHVQDVFGLYKYGHALLGLV